MTRGRGRVSERMEEERQQLRRGPWTVEEDLLLFNYVAEHGEGRWNALARAAGLQRTGKSCRLRWLNYLHPDVRRGNITPEEQLLILQLHSRFGNRWSKIARFLPGRTDNEIKNFWRTRVQKHARQLRYDAGSNAFRDAMRQLWMPRLLQQIQSPSSGATNSASCVGPTAAAALPCQQPDVVGSTITTSPLMWPEAISGTSTSSSPSTSFFSGSYAATVGNGGGVGWTESESMNMMEHYAPEIEAGGWASSSRDHFFSSGSDLYMWSVEDDCAWSIQHEIDVTY